jgi:CDP-glucose 4,6-dehydratase
MENMVTENLFSNIYKDKTVLVTGHTGFKGSWLTLWLTKMGAHVIGYSLEAPTTPSHFDLLQLDSTSIIGDIRDQEKLNSVFAEYKPDIVFHLAAQPLVLESYLDPVETYETNVIGTLKIFEACRLHHVKAIVNITSDKCYENKEWIWGYRENDPMGGFDPYSSSKGCAEILTSSYRNSYFNPAEYGNTHTTLLASCRAGNVIGGGDWAKDRLIPDLIRAIETDQPLTIRNPHAIRPWQHVLEPLSGYLLIGQKLLEGKKEYATAWNFGPDDDEIISVGELVEHIKKFWNKFDYNIVENTGSEKHEATILKLDCTKAKVKLGWKAVWNNQQTFEHTTEWYKTFYEDHNINTAKNLLQYIHDAKKKDLPWVK